MALSPSTSVQGHQVNVCHSPIDLLSKASHPFLAILILLKTLEMQVREREREIEQWCKIWKNGINSPNDS
jgi:hypothetical protein